MKNKIRQILREETSGFDPKMLKVLYQYMNNLTKDYRWYTDTPEQRFEYTPESIWLINPETKQWVLELKKDETLLWHWDFHPNFERYFNMELSDYDKFIKIWVEDVLNRGVSSTFCSSRRCRPSVEDALNRGVSSTVNCGTQRTRWVEDVLKNGEELK